MKIYFNEAFVETSRETDDLWVKGNNGNMLYAFFEGVNFRNPDIVTRLVIEWANGQATNELPMNKSFDGKSVYMTLPILKAGETKFTIRIYDNTDSSSIVQHTAIFTRVVKESVDASDDTNIDPDEYLGILNAIENNTTEIAKNGRDIATNKQDIQDLQNNKVDKTTTPNQVYGTNESGGQTTIPYKNDWEYQEKSIIIRGNDGRAKINAPLLDEEIANKGYVDQAITNSESDTEDKLNRKADKTFVNPAFKDVAVTKDTTNGTYTFTFTKLDNTTKEVQIDTSEEHIIDVSRPPYMDGDELVITFVGGEVVRVDMASLVEYNTFESTPTIKLEEDVNHKVKATLKDGSVEVKHLGAWYNEFANAEDIRKQNESDRIAAEATRVSNENGRIANENTRKENETTRINNENTRIDNENERKAYYDSVKPKIDYSYKTSQDNKARINGIENLLEGTTYNFVDDNTTAIRKDIPTNASGTVMLNSMSGNTVKTTNLIPFPYDDSGPVGPINGITWKINSDGTITANGTATATTSFYIIANSKKLSLPQGQYYFSCSPEGSSIDTYWGSVHIEDNYIRDNNTFTYGGKILDITINVIEGITLNNLTFKPMLNKGSEALPYEPYFEGLHSAKNDEIITHGKNLFDISKITAADNSKEIKIENNTFSFKNIVSMATSSCKINIYLKAGTYSISGNVKLEDGKPGGWSVYSEDTGLIINNCWVGEVAGNFQIKTSGNYDIVFYCNYNSNPNTTATYSNIQIELGNKSTRYSPMYINHYPIDELIKQLPGYGLGFHLPYSNEFICNEIDLVNKKYIQRVDIINMENIFWEKAKLANRDVFVSETLKNKIKPGYNDPAIISSKYDAVGFYESKDKGTWLDAYNSIFVYDTEYLTLSAAEFTQKVSGQKLVYGLKEPIVSDLPADIIEYYESEPGGYIEFVNPDKVQTPSSITLQEKVGA